MRHPQGECLQEDKHTPVMFMAVPSGTFTSNPKSPSSNDTHESTTLLTLPALQDGGIAPHAAGAPVLRSAS